MVLGDHNPLSSDGVVKVIEGEYSIIKIIFETSYNGFYIVRRGRRSTQEYIHGSGQNVKIYKTLAGAEKAAKKL